MREPLRDAVEQSDGGTADVGRTKAIRAVASTKIYLILLACSAVMAVLYWAREAFIPIVLGVLTSYALEPVVRALMRLRLPRTLAAAVTVAVLAGSVVFGAYSLADDAAAIVSKVPEAATRLRQILRRGGSGPIQQVQEAAAELQRTANEATGSTPAPRGVQRVQVEEPAVDVREYLSWGSMGALSFAGQAVLILFFVFFLLASGDLFKRKLVRIAGPSLAAKKVTVNVLDDINRQIERFLLIRVVTSIAVGVGTWIAFAWIGVNQAALWGLAAGVFNIVPYFGPVIVATGTFVGALLQFDSASMAGYVAAVSLLITSIEGWLLTPWLTSRAAQTNEIAVFIGLIFWSFVWGIWGMLLAVPMLVAFKACCDHIEGLKPVSELLGD